MNNLIFKTLLVLSITALIVACDKLPLAKKGDKYLWLTGHANYPNGTPNWGQSEVKPTAYFGKYDGSGGLFQDYYGDPIGPIVAVWRVTTYPGVKPEFRDCEAIKPTFQKNLKFNSPEYNEAMENHGRLYGEYNECRQERHKQRQEAKAYVYYYARSPGNYLPILPSRPESHALYDINVSFGPIGDVSLSGLNTEQQATRDQLSPKPCRRRHRSKTCYRLPGADSSLYYMVRSIHSATKDGSGKAASNWQHPEPIRVSPRQWYEIKGISISKEQYESLEERCKQSPFNCYLDTVDGERSGLITATQQQYIKAVAWDIDTDEKAVDALIKKAKNYRHE